jgi:hypothetical protein
MLVQRPTPNLEDQASVFMAQLYPQALGTHFSRLLRHAWVTVGLFFNPGHHTGEVTRQPTNIKNENCYQEAQFIVIIRKL